MPIPKISSDPSIRTAHDACLYVLKEDFDREMEKIMARLNSMEDQLRYEKNSHNEHLIESATCDFSETNLKLQVDNPEPDKEVIQVQDEDLPEQTVNSVHFSLSAWTYPFVLGLVDAGRWDLVFAVLLMFLNFGMQAMFSYIILGQDFIGEDFQIQVEFAERWRRAFAHDFRYVDLSDRSLVTRVCAGDGSLILSNQQATLVSHINSYMGLKHDEFEVGFFQPGILLCMLCILLWALCVYKEFRNTWHTLEGILHLPRTSKTVLRNNSLVSLSTLRFKWLVSTCLTRFAIAAVLLGAGMLWLARTTSITELMLNAVALNAILDVDEFLFDGFTPLSIHVAVESLEPMRVKHTRQRSQIESFVLFLLLLFTFVVPYFTLLNPLGQTMLAVKLSLCGGFQEFVVAQNGNSQVITGRGTVPATSDANLTVLERAVKTHMEEGNRENSSYFAAETPRQFEEVRLRSVAEEANQLTFCIETEHLDPGGSLFGDELLTYAVSLPRLRTAAAMLGRYDVETCEAAKDLCNRTDASLLRTICGRTCQCTDPHALPWLKVPEQGCSTPCLKLALASFEQEPCQDQAIDQRWFELWDGYAPALNQYLGTDISQSTTFFNDILGLISTIKTLGCSALANPKLQMEVVSQKLWCEGADFFRPMAMVCPITCGCQTANPPAYCPSCTSNHSAG